MTTRTFAAWVEPIAAELRARRSQIVRIANQVPQEVWGLPSSLPDWSYKDLLAHLATGDWVCQTILRAVVENKPVEVTEVANPRLGNGGERRTARRA